MKEKVVVDKAISLYTESFGDPAHEPIILIMGAMSSAVWWPDEFCSQLAKMGRYVIRYDHRDTGKSTSYEPGQAPYSVEELADDVVRVIDGYGLEAAHLVGMSLGGFLSQLVALKYPKRVKSLTLIASERLADADPDMPAFDPAIIEYHQRAESLDWSDRDAVVAYQVGAWRINSGTAHAFDAEKIQNIAELNFDRTPNILTTFNHTTLGGGERWLGRLNEIAVPTLIIHGTEDPVLPYVHGLALKEAIRGSKMLTLEGTGHELHHEDWPRIIQAIKGQTSWLSVAPYNKLLHRKNYSLRSQFSGEQGVRRHMKISVIPEQVAETLDAENHFIVREVFDVHLSDQGFELSTRSVSPYRKDYISDDDSDEDSACYGAFIDQELVGKIELNSTWNDLASIEHIVVSHTHRGKGVAHSLIEFAKKWALSRQLLGIRLETQTNNVPACNLYAKCGFTLGGIDLFTYKTRPQVSNETAMYWYWFSGAQDDA